MDEPPSFLSAIMSSFAMKRPLMSEILPVNDKLKGDWLLEACISDQPSKTFDRPPSFGCMVGDRGKSEVGSVIYSDYAPPSYTDVARQDGSEAAGVDQNLSEVNFEEDSSTPPNYGEIYPCHGSLSSGQSRLWSQDGSFHLPRKPFMPLTAEILLSPTKDVPSIWNYGYQSSKVHGVMCTKLMKVVDRIDKIFPEIEAARPRSSSGIVSLCLLESAIDKAKSLVRHCSESSKLYLALTGHAVLSRCEKSKKILEQSLSQIQDIPVYLASNISLIIAELREMKLGLDPSEEEAGEVLRALLKGHDAGNCLEKEYRNECIRIAAIKLHITSQKALLMELRSIKKLLDKLGEGDSKQPKKQILMFFFALLKRYGKSIASGPLENDNVV